MHLRLPRHSPVTVLASAAVLVALTGCAGGAAPATLSAMRPDAGSADGSAPTVSGDLSELGVDDGYIPEGETVSLTDDVPAVTRLDGRLRDALLRAEDAAAAAGRDVRFTLVDGWRSPRYQQYLFDRAVAKYGNAEEAARWVKGPAESKHVQGEAVDLATADAMDWLNRFGGEFGLCQIYANEAWHFELAANESGTCPAPLTDASAG